MFCDDYLVKAVTEALLEHIGIYGNELRDIKYKTYHGNYDG